MIWPVILSGGSGTRLWPLSRAATPKQMLALAGPRTLLQDTAARCAGDRFHPPVVVANAAHLASIAEQLTACGSPPSAIMLEPAGRNTAPAIALAAHWIRAHDPEGLMLVMPSDHVIADVHAFHLAIHEAAHAASDGWLVTFGIRATHAETGYGYIRIGEPVSGGVSRVEQFVEKPNAATAQRYIADGGYAWNGGIFLMRCDRYLTALEEHAPAIASAIAAAMADARTAGLAVTPDAATFAACPADSIDYAVMERDRQVAVVPADMGWSDIGSWDALIDVAGRDSDGNSLSGDVIALNTTNSLIRSEGPLVAAIGVDGMTIVATGDAVLVAAAGHSQQVKAIVDRIAADGRREHLDAVRFVHDWGSERILARGKGVTVREYEISPGHAAAAQDSGAATSLTVLDGQGDVTTDSGQHRIAAGDTVPISPGASFTLTNLGDIPFRIVATRIDR